VKSLENEQKLLPNHIAIIMDGNGRWAEKRGLARALGHEQGAKTAENIIRYASELGIKYVTLYAFSSENWRRPKEEIDAVMKILERYLKNDVDQLVKSDVKIVAIGNLNSLPTYVKNAIKIAVEKTAQCKKLVITLALSYGSLEEIVYALKNLMHAHLENRIDLNNLDEKLLKKYLYTLELPDPDLFIRTGGEIRLSNFLLLQISYSELYFCKTLWPDFKRSDLDCALKSFRSRDRRFGSIKTR
jgi:undecaprenyl diphosphate synthase